MSPTAATGTRTRFGGCARTPRWRATCCARWWRGGERAAAAGAGAGARRAGGAGARRAGERTGAAASGGVAGCCWCGGAFPLLVGFFDFAKEVGVLGTPADLGAAARLDDLVEGEGVGEGSEGAARLVERDG